ncbi:uncharacterized protein LOC34623619 [Cyclospora cayetanensis]|uniref:Uncharacterized protein LOC34623619 n=1 Tax=Cyclospora cayetanensis TaxID=88456 RepID=A0A6P6RZ72_9EIME|nr:uncharacterized protein LOC34623619 [Cyclospora cayetanensis]
MPAVVPGRAPLPFVAANAAAEQAKSDSSLDTSQRTAAASPPAEEMLIVIVPYRRRRAHLRLMLRTVTDYLEGLLQDPGEQKQREGKTCGRTDFCFIVAEQRDSRPFHRSLLLNAACLWAAQQRGWYREYSHQSSIGSDVPAVGTVRVCGAPRQRQNVTHIGGESGEGPLREKGQDSQVEICRKIQTARRVFVCLHDVDVVPRGKDFDKLARLGRPLWKHESVDGLCWSAPGCYFPAPQVGVARHLYGEPWSLSMVVCLRLEDVMKADGHDLRYEGWGFEDEDFLLRLQSVGVSVQRSALLPELATEGRGRAGCVSVRTQAWDSGPCCASGCCSWTFSRRLCSCAPFKELDVFSVEKLREAMAMKLRSLQGRRNRWLFCSLWPCKEDSPEGCVQQEGSSTEKRGKGLADDQQKAGYGTAQHRLCQRELCKIAQKWKSHLGAYLFVVALYRLTKNFCTSTAWAPSDYPRAVGVRSCNIRAQAGGTAASSTTAGNSQSARVCSTSGSNSWSCGNSKQAGPMSLAPQWAFCDSQRFAPCYELAGAIRSKRGCISN